MICSFVDGSVDCTRKREAGGANYGGICAVVLREHDEIFREMHICGELIEKGDDMVVTNNTMELSAIRLAAQMMEAEIKSGQEVHIWTDSQYAQGCLRYNTTWDPKQNVELIISVRDLVAKPNVFINHVRGHRGIGWNELANLGAQKCVTTRESRKGFSGVRTLNVARQCFFCQRFACDDRDRRFGLVTSKLYGSYSPSPCGGTRFLAHSSERIERFVWRSTLTTGSTSVQS